MSHLNVRFWPKADMSTCLDPWSIKGQYRFLRQGHARRRNMPRNGAGNDLIASYSALRAWPLFCVFMLLAAILLWGWFSAVTDPNDLFSSAYRTFSLLTGTLLFVWYLLPRLRFLLRQLLSAKRAAIWIEGGCLTYLDQRLFSIPCDEIASISPDVFGTFNQEGINIRRRDGRERILPTGTLVEPTEVIVDRLRRFCIKGTVSDHSLRDALP